jgi:hypothetical protein
MRAGQAQAGAMKKSPVPTTDLREPQKVMVERMQLIQRTFPLWRAAAVTRGYLCVLDDHAVCHIPITVFQATTKVRGTDGSDTNVDYCIGIAPEFVIIRERNKPKQILWEVKVIDPDTGMPSSATPTGSTLDFLGDGDRGILMLQNIFDSQGRPQLRDGKRASSGTFNISNDHRENGTATYLPVVVHTVNGEVSLCGTPDPTIYNVN